MIDIIESVTRTLVPFGISNSIDTRSLAILGKIVTPITPPPIAPKVKIKIPIKTPRANTLYSNMELSTGA